MDMQVTGEPEITGGFMNFDSFTFTMSEPSEWHCELFGLGNELTWHPQDNHVPCWFWRKMQYLCFGNKWIKTINGEKK